MLTHMGNPKRRPKTGTHSGTNCWCRNGSLILGPFLEPKSWLQDFNLASTNNTTGQQHCTSPLVSTTSRQHWPVPLAAGYKHVGHDDANDVDDDDDNGDDDDNDYDADYDYGDDDEANGDDGDRDDELKIHSNMCVHECARRTIHLPSWPSRTGQHHWAAPLGSTTGQHY